MTTLSKEDVVRLDNELLAMIQKHFPSLPLDDRYTDWKKWLCFARAVYSHGEQAARADLVAENERLKSVPMKYRRMAFNAELQDENKELRTALAAAEAREAKLRAAVLVQGLQLHADKTKSELRDELNRLFPSDDSALREMIAGEIEAMKRDWYSGNHTCCVEDFMQRRADAIRALAEKARHGN